MVQVGLLLSDVPTSVPPSQQFRDVLRIVAAAQANDFTYIAIGQHFLYGDLRWLQPVPLLAAKGGVATLDVVTEGRLVFGVGLGYRPEEFGYLDVPFAERAARMDESLQLMRRLWTQDEVDFRGRFWTLEQVRPHLKPVQSPYPPIWIGGHSLAGARRAGRYGDAYACPPETPVDEAAQRYAAVKAGYDARGKAFGPQPLRRNVLVAGTREQAVTEYARVAQGRYITYAQRGLDVMADTDLERDFAAAVAGHAVIGTADDVTKQLLDLVTTLPVDPLLVRPQWPTMDADETIAAIRRLGAEVVPALRAVEPRTSI